MGIFKDVYCAECGTKTSMLSRTKLVDDSYICSKCKNELPNFMRNYVDEHYTIADYRKAKQWKQDAITQYSEIYVQTEAYGDVGVDSNHGLFCLGHFTKGVTPLLRFEDVLDFDFAFNPQEYKEGILGNKVTGDTHFCVTMKKPEFYYETTLERGAKAKAKKSFFGNKVTYEHPKRLNEFETVFIEAYIANMPENAGGAVDEVKQAMTLFMIDDFGATDVAGLTATRDALLQSFQAGNNERQIAKINSAYELLRDKVGR